MFVSIIRGIAFLLICLIFVGLCYTALDLFCELVLEGIGKVQHSMNQFVFWLLFLLFGILILRILWAIFMMIVTVFTSLVIKISPSNSLSEWFSTVNVLINLVFFIYTVWKDYNTSNFFGVIVCIVISFMGIGMGMAITNATDRVILDREIAKSPLKEYFKSLSK